MIAGTRIPIMRSPAGGGAADLDHLVRLRALSQDREEAFLHALLHVLHRRRQHVRDLDALRLGEHLLRAGLGARAVAAERLGEAADAAREHTEALELGD